MTSAPDHATAPDPAERRDEWPRWPLWAPLAAVFFGAGAAILVVAVVSGIVKGLGVHVSSKAPGLTAATTAALDVGVVAAAIGIAALTTRPRPWQFGLRPAPLRFAVGISFIAVVSFYFFEIAYGIIFNPHNPQKIVDDLGANRSTAMLIVGAVVVILVAPVCEELFFRGFLYRILRTRMALWPAAIVDGVLFGLVHGSWVILPILTFLGVLLCWVYERTGSLFATIAIHALNNTISYGASTDHGWPVALSIGGLVIAGCMVVPRALPRGPEPVPA
jgi:membrane protease YdiL (CAAX protease family)